MTSGSGTDGRLSKSRQNASPSEDVPLNEYRRSDRQLSDLLDHSYLGVLRDTLYRLSGFRLSLTDSNGQAISSLNCDSSSLQNQDPKILHEDSGRWSASIIVEGRAIGRVTIEDQRKDQVAEVDADADNTARQLLVLWATHLANLCNQAAQIEHRVDELSILYRLSTLLSAHRDLREVLDAAAKSAAEVMNVKAASIRLLDEQRRELFPKAVFNLSSQYLDKGPVVVEESELYRRTLAGEVVYVQDMANDPRVMYPEDAHREGLVSILSAPMIYENEPVGVIRVYTGEPRSFTQFEIVMLRAVAQLLATAIENARLNDEKIETERMQQQIQLAADVQRRMMPAEAPRIGGIDIASRCVPCFELGGDFYDFIQLGSQLGVAIGDVVGKGIAASLLMASVRAALHAHAEVIYDIDRIIARVNATMVRQTLDNEFVTMFYGVIDPVSRRLTYCNAGHEYPLLLRGGEIHKLATGGMIVGVDESAPYDMGIFDLQSGDLLVIYTDGLCDALDFRNQRFGRERIIAAMHDRSNASAHDALNHILWQMRRYVGLNRSVDDTTLVVIKVD